MTMEWQRQRFAAFDLETTGTKAGEDRITELGVAIFEGGVVVDRFQRLVNPGIPIPEEVQRVTGISDADVADAPRLEDVLDEFLELLCAQPILAYNAQFDLAMLGGELERLGRADAVLPDCYDPFPFCWVYLRSEKKTRNAQLGTICAYMGIELESAHRADHDAEAAGRLFLAMAEHMVIPDSASAFLDQQRGLSARVEEDFRRMRARRGENRGSLDVSTLTVELGAAYVYGEESDAIRFLYSRLPDVRDVARSST